MSYVSVVFPTGQSRTYRIRQGEKPVPGDLVVTSIDDVDKLSTTRSLMRPSSDVPKFKFGVVVDLKCTSPSEVTRAYLWLVPGDQVLLRQRLAEHDRERTAKRKEILTELQTLVDEQHAEELYAGLAERHEPVRVLLQKLKALR